MPVELADNYVSKSQQARVVTESWGRNELYCANCTSTSLSIAPNNNKAFDYLCHSCGACFQLKGQSKIIGKTIRDGAYGAMIQAIREDRTPNLFLMQYALPSWQVVNLILIPQFAFPESSIIRCKPLLLTARRAGWIGCNIDLGKIAKDARIPVVSSGKPEPPSTVRAHYEKLRPLGDIKATQRGWTLDVLNIVRKLGKSEFTNEDVYSHERELEQMHPENRHVREKIRQQLQVLRDSKLLVHLQAGKWLISKV